MMLVTWLCFPVYVAPVCILHHAIICWTVSGTFLYSLHPKSCLVWYILVSMDVVLGAWSHATIISALTLPLIRLSPTSGLSQFQLSVDGAIHGGPCFAMVDLMFVHIILRSSSFGAILPIYFKMLRVSFKIVAFKTTIPHPPFLLVCSLWVLDLVWKFPCIMRSSLSFTSIASMSSFVHLRVPAAYVITGKAYIFMT